MEHSVLFAESRNDIDRDARMSVKERSLALKREKGKKEKDAKIKEKQKKFKEMRHH